MKNLNPNILDEAWEKNPEYIRKFYENLPRYQALCDEVEYIIQKKLTSENIEVSQVVSRSKNLLSFCEKISRKKYSEPFSEITDFAGVRVVFLYAHDRPFIEKIIENEFDVVEKVDKTDQANHDQFGYGALHYLCKLKSKHHTGVRYDDLKSLVFEIQVRTILQDAWAIVAHHLSYKSESDIPKQLRRKLNALSGLFETADSQFELIREKREKYTNDFIERIGEPKTSLRDEINLDNLIAYMSFTFPDRKSTDLADAAELLKDINSLGYSNLSDLDEDVKKWERHVFEYEKQYPPWSASTNKNTVFRVSGILRSVLSFAHPSYDKSRHKYDDIIEKLKREN